MVSGLRFCCTIENGSRNCKGCRLEAADATRHIRSQRTMRPLLLSLPYPVTAVWSSVGDMAGRTGTWLR
jgi:hypothetical protein